MGRRQSPRGRPAAHLRRAQSGDGRRNGAGPRGPPRAGATALASGQITGAIGQSFKAGDLGSFTIGDKGVVLLGGPTVFNAADIDQFDF